jgi:cadmium resistance protein CadD (predicted permease)
VQKIHLQDRQLSGHEVDVELLVFASVAAENLGIPLPLFVNQALQEKLLSLMDKGALPSGKDSNDGGI